MILIVESGATKTEWNIIDDNKGIEKFNSEGLSLYYQSKEEIEAKFNELKDKIGPNKVEIIYFFGTGVATEDSKSILEKLLKKTFGNQVKCELYSDIYAAGIALFSDSKGIACILGTGSNSAYFENNKIIQQIPPLGFWLGDEGSGGHLGKMLILSYLHNDLPLDLRSKFEDKYGKKDRLDILNMAYKSEFPNRSFAAFTYFIKENENHQFIDSLINNSFQSFFDLYVLKYNRATEREIGFVGSVAFNFQVQLFSICTKNNLNLPRIIKNPIELLTQKFTA